MGDDAALKAGTERTTWDSDAASLYELHGPRAFRVAFLLAFDRPLAEDAVHQGFMNAYASWQKGRVRGDFGPYFTRCAVMEVRVSQRRRAIARRLGPRLVVREVIAAEEADLVIRDEIRWALKSLPLRQREVIVLRYYGDMTLQDIARALKTTVSTVKTHHWKALRSLKNILGPEGAA